LLVAIDEKTTVILGGVKTIVEKDDKISDEMEQNLVKISAKIFMLSIDFKCNVSKIADVLLMEFDTIVLNAMEYFQNIATNNVIIKKIYDIVKTIPQGWLLFASIATIVLCKILYNHK
jgi:hypothetical protein